MSSNAVFVPITIVLIITAVLIAEKFTYRGRLAECERGMAQYASAINIPADQIPALCWTKVTP